jgi:hypothetical protein
LKYKILIFVIVYIISGCSKELINSYKKRIIECKTISNKKDIVINSLNREIYENLKNYNESLLYKDKILKRKLERYEICRKSLLDIKVDLLEHKKYIKRISLEKCDK